jgi:peptidoglycan/LPS O-acetylase OafA/YrhL
VFGIFVLVFGGADRRDLFTEMFAAAFYVYDFLIAWVGVEGQALVQLWTLSLEEQFYFVWPLLLIAALKVSKPRRMRVLVAAMGVFVVLLPTLRMSLEPELGARTLESFIFGLSILRPDSLVLGCLAAMLWRVDPSARSPRWERALPVAGNVALVLFGATLLLGGFTPFAPFVSPFYNLTVLVLPLWILDLSRRPHTRVAQLLAHPICRWFGKRSYGIYIWHLLIYFPIQAFFNDVFDRPKVATLAAFPLAFAGTIGVAVLSWNYIETPALRYKQRFARTTD